MGDCGLTGRKIIVDTYGGMARHGGGAFSGKDPSKVDRSAAYAARWVAKNIVAAGLADRAEVQVAYAIGVAHPVSVMVETFGTENEGLTPGQIARAVDEVFDLRPGSFREELDLHRPIYQKTAAYGHFGRDDADFTWEQHRQGRRAALRRRPLTGASGAAYRSSRVTAVSSTAQLDSGVAAPATTSLIAQVEPMTTARALRGPFDYRLPEELSGDVDVGSMLVVPFGRREVLGVVVGSRGQQRGRRGEAAGPAAGARAGAPPCPSTSLGWPNGSPASTARRSPARSPWCCRRGQHAA